MADLIISIPNQVPRRYPVPDSFTYRELQTIKQITGCRPAELEDALTSGDPDIVVALATICAARAGHKISADDLFDLEVGAITIDGDESDVDESDPTSGATDPNEVAPETILEAGGTPASLASTG